MNVYKKELKFHYKSTIFWLMGTISLIAISFSKFSLTSESELGTMDKVVETMPDIIKAFYGMSGINISSIEGYSAVVINFAIITIALHGIFLGMSHIGLEHKNKTMDFIFVKPLTKRTILFKKITAGITCIAIFVIVISISTIVSIKSFGDVSNEFLGRMIISFAVVDLFFYSSGVFISVLSKRKKFAGVGASVFLVFYLIAVVSRMSDKISDIGYVSPMEIVSGTRVMEGFEWIPLTGVILISLLLLYLSMNKIDDKEIV